MQKISKFLAFVNPLCKPRFFLSTAKKSWVYGEKPQLYNVELANIMKTLETSNPEFIMLDVREPEEIALADIPSRNEKGFSIPKINIPFSRILTIDSHPLPEIPRNKYLVCLCHHGIRSARVCFHLKNRGYKTINLLGGIDELAKHLKEIPRY